MDSGGFHFLFDMAEREPLLLLAVVLGVPVMFGLLIAATVRQLHPFVIWLVLVVGFFGLSQVFPDNRNQRSVLAAGDIVLCTVLTWWWCRRIAPGIRSKLRQSGSAG